MPQLGKTRQGPVYESFPTAPFLARFCQCLPISRLKGSLCATAPACPLGCPCGVQSAARRASPAVIDAFGTLCTHAFPQPSRLHFMLHTQMQVTKKGAKVYLTTATGKDVLVQTANVEAGPAGVCCACCAVPGCQLSACEPVRGLGVGVSCQCGGRACRHVSRGLPGN